MNNKNILFSIICPAYNSQEFVSECIESVIKQTYPNWELIIVDDGSTDKTSAIIDEYASKDERIRAFHKENEGQLPTREFGIKQAKGDYVVFCDSDDLMEYNSLELLSKEIKDNNPDAVLFDLYKLTRDGKTYPLQNISIHETLTNKRDIIKYCFVENNCISLCVYCFKRESLLKERTYVTHKKIKSHEDFMMLFEIVKSLSSLSILNKVLYCYRENVSSTTHRLTQEDRINGFVVCNNIYNKIIDEFGISYNDFSFRMKDRLARVSILLIYQSSLSKSVSQNKTLFTFIKKTFLYKYFCKKYRFNSKYQNVIRIMFNFGFYHLLDKIVTHHYKISNYHK